MFNFDLEWILKALPAIIIGLTIHELAHAYTAYKLGDNTARDEGRLTLNPLKHLDPIGFIMIVIFHFGWAKPVSFNPDNLKKRHRDEILIALAGPVSNFLLALLFLVLARVFYGFEFFYATENGIFVVKLLLLWGVINFGLFVFNMIPIPPLDGSHLYTTFLAKSNPGLFSILYRFGTWGLLIIIIAQNALKVEILPLGTIINGLAGFFMQILAFN